MGSHKKEHRKLGSIVGSPYFGKLPSVGASGAVGNL